MKNLEYASVCQLFRSQVEKNPQAPALFYKKNGIWAHFTRQDWVHESEKISSALRHFGIQKGDRVALISENRPEWAFVDMGVLHLGAVNVAIYPTLVPKQIAYILNDCSARAIFVSNEEHLQKVIEIYQDVPSLEHIIYFNGDYAKSGETINILSLDQLVKKGVTVEPSQLTSLWSDLLPKDLATFIYTSGTTGDPKGVMLSHGNLVSNILACKSHMPLEKTLGKNLLNFSFLPLCHALERTAGYYFPLSLGVPIAYAEALDKIVVNLSEVKPTHFISVPRVLEKVYGKVMDKMERAGGLKKKLFYWALEVGKAFQTQKRMGKVISPFLAFQQKMADQLVFRKIKDLMGGRLQMILVGGAPMPPEIGAFFDAMGITILQGYGLTETSPVVSVNVPHSLRFDSVGVALPGVEIKTADDGEIMVKGDLVMQGYFNLPDKTQEVMTEDGWFKTGDIGVIDSDGHILITDRKKDIIVTAGGKNVAPQMIENKMKLDSMIEQICVIGDKRKYLSALIVPTFENLKVFAEENNLSFQSNEDLIEMKEVKDLMQKNIDLINKEFAKFEQIRKFSLLPREFSEKEDEITPTMKVKRKNIQQKYSDLIEKMY